jgi:5-methyltetrahydrofolate--homocysteine methyltransferase
MEAEKEKLGDLSTAERIVLATVKGDVHDIGKNIVGVVLGCNGYEVTDLGVMVPAEKILDKAAEIGAGIVGLSGLITPSLDEMVHVGREMERRGMKLPLLIGGATTSRVHTAVKIAPQYSPPTVHVRDASRVVGVVQNLLDAKRSEGYAAQVREEYATARAEHERKQSAKSYLTLEAARAKRFAPDWKGAEIARPEALGVKALRDFPLDRIVPYIDWTPYFHAWELRGAYPRIFENAKYGEKARELYDDARRLLDRIVAERLLRANGVYGFWPAASVGDDIEVYADESRARPIAVIHCLRQQAAKDNGRAHYSLADFIAPKDSGKADYLGAFAVTAGEGAEALARAFEADHDDYNAIAVKALADRLAEAFAELLHKTAREAWGYGRGENLANEDLIKERYRGIRPAPGYPACPDHTEKRTLFDLLEAEKNAGVALTENFAMTPAASVSGLYFAHPEARYFDVGRIARDQVAEYATRKGMPLETAERWLGPNLGYTPGNGA